MTARLLKHLAIDVFEIGLLLLARWLAPTNLAGIGLDFPVMCIITFVITILLIFAVGKPAPILEKILITAIHLTALVGIAKVFLK